MSNTVSWICLANFIWEKFWKFNKKWIWGCICVQGIEVNRLWICVMELQCKIAVNSLNVVFK